MNYELFSENYELVSKCLSLLCLCCAGGRNEFMSAQDCTPTLQISYERKDSTPHKIQIHRSNQCSGATRSSSKHKPMSKGAPINFWRRLLQGAENRFLLLKRDTEMFQFDLLPCEICSSFCFEDHFSSRQRASVLQQDVPRFATLDCFALQHY